jgi:hypothetical protein
MSNNSNDDIYICFVSGAKFGMIVAVFVILADVFFK